MRVWPHRIGYLAVAVLLAGIYLVGGIPLALASGDGHGDTDELKHKVDLEGKTGFNLFMARMYNENRPLYALLVTGVMAFLGILVAQITGLVLRLIGIG